MVYLPKEKILFNADLYSPPAQGAPLPAPNAANKTLMQNIRKLKLDVERHVAVHSARVGTHEEFMRIFARRHEDELGRVGGRGQEERHMRRVIAASVCSLTASARAVCAGGPAGGVVRPGKWRPDAAGRVLCGGRGGEGRCRRAISWSRRPATSTWRSAISPTPRAASSRCGTRTATGARTSGSGSPSRAARASRIYNGHLYLSRDDAVVRFPLKAGQLLPAGPMEMVVSGFPQQRVHPTKTLTFDNAGRALRERRQSVECLHRARSDEDERPESVHASGARRRRVALRREPYRTGPRERRAAVFERPASGQCDALAPDGERALPGAARSQRIESLAGVFHRGH